MGRAVVPLVGQAVLAGEGLFVLEDEGLVTGEEVGLVDLRVGGGDAGGFHEAQGSIDFGCERGVALALG